MGKRTKKETLAEQAKEFAENHPQATHRDAPAMRLGNICPDPRNPRKLEITPENDPKLLELADSIRQFGDVIEPIVVRLRPEASMQGDWHPECHYMLISGHRRLAAAKLAGLETIHCSAWENVSDNQAFEMQLVENLHRADLLPMEEANAYKRMKEELGYNYSEIALRVGKSEKHIGRYIKMLSLPDEISQKIDGGEISISKAQYLCSLPDAVIKDILDHNSYWLREDISSEQMRRNILAYYMKELGKKIPFDLKKEYAGDEGETWPACTKCPHKNQLTMFEEFAKDGRCPYAPCFRAKQYIAEENVENASDGEDEGDEGEEDYEEEDERKASAGKAKKVS